MDPKEYEEDLAKDYKEFEDAELKAAIAKEYEDDYANYRAKEELKADWGSGEEYLSVEQRFQMNIVAQREERQIRAQAIQLAIQASAAGLVTDVTYLDAAEGILAFLVEGDDTSD